MKKYILNGKKNYLQDGGLQGNFSGLQAYAPMLMQGLNMALPTKDKQANQMSGVASSALMSSKNPKLMALGAGVKAGEMVSDALTKEDCFTDPLTGEETCADVTSGAARVGQILTNPFQAFTNRKKQQAELDKAKTQANQRMEVMTNQASGQQAMTQRSDMLARQANQLQTNNFMYAKKGGLIQLLKKGGKVNEEVKDKNKEESKYKDTLKNHCQKLGYSKVDKQCIQKGKTSLNPKIKNLFIRYENLIKNK